MSQEPAVHATYNRAVHTAIERSVNRLRGLQMEGGYWESPMGYWDTMYTYGTSLVLLGHDPRSEVLQTIADDIESHHRADGGISHCPEAGSIPEYTQNGLMLLRRLRPESKVIPELEGFLKKYGRPGANPIIMAHEWVLDPTSHDRIRKFRPPPRRLSRAAMNWAQYFIQSIPSKPGSSDALRREIPGFFARRVAPVLSQPVMWPDPGMLADYAEKQKDPLPPIFTTAAYMAFYALQELAGDGTPLGRDRHLSRKFAEWMLDRFLFDDGSIYVNLVQIPWLLTLKVLGRDEDFQRVKKVIEERHFYEKGYYVWGPNATLNVYETGCVARALLIAGVPKDDEVITDCCDFYDQGRWPDCGVWGYRWQPPAGAKRGSEIDSDDSGLGMDVLLLAESPHVQNRLADVISTLWRFQHECGGFACFDVNDWGVFNIISVSVSNRCLRSLVRLGVDKNHRNVQRALEWIESQQLEDGSWFEWWSSDYIYGTVLSVEVLLELGWWEPGHPDHVKALDWILNRQHADGGWGSDYYGKDDGHTSSVESTAWALYGLCKLHLPGQRPTEAIERAVAYLVEQQNEDGTWPYAYWYRAHPEYGYYCKFCTEAFALQALGTYLETLPEGDARIPV